MDDKSNNLLADYAAKKQDICIKNDTISDSLFREYGVNRGLRDVNGKGSSDRSYEYFGDCFI